LSDFVRCPSVWHTEHTLDGFTATYNIDRLVWYQIFGDVHAAIAREKQLKRVATREEDTVDRIEEPDLAGPVRRMGKVDFLARHRPQIPPASSGQALRSPAAAGSVRMTKEGDCESSMVPPLEGAASFMLL